MADWQALQPQGLWNNLLYGYGGLLNKIGSPISRFGQSVQANPQLPIYGLMGNAASAVGNQLQSSGTALQDWGLGFSPIQSTPSGGLLYPDVNRQQLVDAAQGLFPLARAVPGAVKDAWRDFSAGAATSGPGMVAYHGTPHTFAPTENNPLGEFDLSKIGSGEGAQAYGHGIYVAENPKVAGEYASTLGQANHAEIARINSQLSNVARQRQDLVDARAIERDPARSWAMLEAHSNLGDQYDALLQERTAVLNKRGTVYNIDIPDEHVDRMLDWDKPLSEMHPDVQQKFTPEGLGLNFRRASEGSPYMAFVDDDGRPVGNFQKGGTRESFEKNWIADAQAQTGRSLYGWLGQPQRTSALLSRAGIPGIKYLDAGSRAAGEGSRNLVLFDPSIARITGKE